MSKEASADTEETAQPSADDRRRALEEQALWTRWKQLADGSARNDLIERHLGYVKVIALSIYRASNPNYVDLRDLIQLGTVGLMDALDRFDPARDIAFRTYAGFRIRGSILSGMENLSELHAQQSFRRRFHRERVEALRSPDAATKDRDVFGEMVELALGLAIGLMLEQTPMFLEPNDVSHGDSNDLLDSTTGFRSMLHTLPESQQRVLRYHYEGGIDFVEIARLMRLSKGRVSQLHKSAIEHLRKQGQQGSRLSLKI